ncbi:arginase family protein [Candidatus Pacearchaeota archaeon]|nr:arginase family protein [Candidatus Pacearchaeota archaeon]
MMLIKIPIESLPESKGSKSSGNAVIAELPKTITTENGRKIEKDNLILEEIHLDNNDLPEAHSLIYENSLEEIESNERIIFIGGDHSASYSTIKAFREICKEEDKEAFLIVFDAHADCENDELNEDYINSRNWLRKLIEDGFPGNKVILIGLRKSSNEENAFLKKNNVKIYNMRDLIEIEEMCDIIMELANADKDNQLYISIDIDVVDSIFVPGVARPEAAGLTTRQLIYFLQRLNLLKNLRVIDVTEINTERDINNNCVKLGAKIVEEVIV